MSKKVSNPENPGWWQKPPAPPPPPPVVSGEVGERHGLPPLRGDGVPMPAESERARCVAIGCERVFEDNVFFCSRCCALLSGARREALDLIYARWKKRPAGNRLGMRVVVEAARRELAVSRAAEVMGAWREESPGAAGRPRRVSLVLAWYDFWVGAYWDRKARALYVLPLPMVGIVIRFGRRT